MVLHFERLNTRSNFVLSRSVDVRLTRVSSGGTPQSARASPRFLAIGTIFKNIVLPTIIRIGCRSTVVVLHCERLNTRSNFVLSRSVDVRLIPFVPYSLSVIRYCDGVVRNKRSSSSSQSFITAIEQLPKKNEISE